ncbi:MAG: hypothetical protein WBN31_09000 [Gammaproteobacteria bacterium]
MNWEAVSAIGEIAGAAGVIITLGYLSIQIRQNTKASRITAVQTATENSSRFSELLISNPDVGAAFWKGLQDPEALSQDELRQFITALNVFMRRESMAFYLHREGVMPDELWTARVGGLSGTLNQPGMHFYLDLAEDTLPVDFRSFLREVTSKPSTMNDKMKRLIGEA